MDVEKLNPNFDINAKYEDIMNVSKRIVEHHEFVSDGSCDPPSYICLAYDIKNYLPKLQQENRELKKQLHESSIETQHLIEKDIECPSNCSKLKELNKSLKASRRVAKHHLNRELDLENQQKEFIEWLEKEIKETREKWGNALTNESLLDVAMTVAAYEEILSKYKEIIGGLDEQ